MFRCRFCQTHFIIQINIPGKTRKHYNGAEIKLKAGINMQSSLLPNSDQYDCKCDSCYIEFSFVYIVIRKIQL